MSLICKSRSILKLAIFTLSLFAPLTLALAQQAESKPNAAPARTSFSHDAHGLEQQYEPLLKAYSKRDDEAIDREFSVFLIPDEDKWFAGYFDAAYVDQLKQTYQTEANDYKRGFVNITTKVLHTSSRFHAHCTPPDPNHQTKLQPRPDAPKPTRDVAVEQFHIEFTSDEGKKFSERANFVYVDGAFRYLGKGAYPFWSMPEGPKKNAPEVEN
jgi:hypothetical protein